MHWTDQMWRTWALLQNISQYYTIFSQIHTALVSIKIKTKLLISSVYNVSNNFHNQKILSIKKK